jgi:hypothetical protein
MKKYFLIGISSLLALTGCEEDFEVAAPYKDITFVYGIMDKLDSVHYIRIQKAFLDENKNAIDMAKEADSSFYKDITVHMQEVENGKVVNDAVLTRVKLEDEGFPKNPPANDQGFFTSPSWAYRYDRKLDHFKLYRLIVSNNATGRNDSSELLAIVNSDTAKGNNNNFFINDFTKPLELDFGRSSSGFEYQLRGTMPKNGYAVEGKIRFHYLEKNVLTNTETRKSAEYIFDQKQFPETTTFILKAANRSLHSFLFDAIGPAPTGVERYLGKCDITVYAVNRALYNYMQVNKAQSGGLTGDQIKPIFTNMRGGDALGMLASRTYRYYEGATISNNTIDSLKLNSLTKSLNIVGKDQ